MSTDPTVGQALVVAQGGHQPAVALRDAEPAGGGRWG